MHFAEDDDKRSPVSSLIAVVVIYKLSPDESSTLRTLMAAAKNVSSEELKFGIVVWDNTPGGQAVEELPEGVVYVPAPENPGLAVAYNHVLELAEANGYEWMLTLDQDSALPEDFLKRISLRTRELAAAKHIGAIVPQLVAGERVMSPFHFIFKAIPRLFPRGFTGTWNEAVYAANSGSILRVKAVREIEGYDPMFPLDLSDTSLFHRLHAVGQRVFIAGDLVMKHDFALLNKKGRMSIERYDASLLDDCAFWDLYMGRAARVERIVRFTVRATKELFTPASADFRRRTLFEVKRRLFATRKARIDAWRVWATRRRDKNLKSMDVQHRLARSVQAEVPPVGVFSTSQTVSNTDLS